MEEKRKCLSTYKKEMLGLGFYFLWNVKKIMMLDIRGKKKFFNLGVSDKKEINFDSFQKKKIYLFILANSNKSFYDITSSFSTLFVGVKIGSPPSAIEHIFRATCKKPFFDLVLFTFMIWELRCKENTRIPRKIIHEGALANPLSIKFPIEYFRLIILLLKKFLNFCYLHFKFQSKLQFLKNFFGLNVLFLQVLWTFLSQFIMISTFDNIFQVCCKELWYFNFFSYINKTILNVAKRLILMESFSLNNLSYMFIPKIFLIKNFYIKTLVKNFLSIYSLNPFFFFGRYIGKTQKKQEGFQGYLSFGSRNRIQKYKLAFF